MTSPGIAGFHPPRTVSNGTTSLPVYISQKGTRPLIVLHELPGMSPTFLDYCRRMAGEGYKVYAPLMFKQPGTQMNNLQSGLFCISREFRALFAASKGGDPERPFVAWLLHLVRDVSAENDGANTGVVGMCLTGGFALAAIAQAPVQAAVACQPSWPPFSKIETLGMSAAQRNAVSARGKTLSAPCAKGYRFAGDKIAKAGHMDAAQAILGDGFERYPDLHGKAHSTLTTNSFSQAVYDDVRAFLAERL